MILNYISYKQLIEDSIKFSKQINRDYDLIIGIPRSGMIPASIISFQLNKPLCTITEFINNEFINGFRMNNKNNIKKVLIIDDSLSSGQELNKNLELVKYIMIERNIIYDTCVIYSSNNTNLNLTYFYKIQPHPRVFQWNIMNHGHLSTAGVDIDGVLCYDPDFLEDDNKKMSNFILSAKPLYIPTIKIHCLITNRLEKYRKETVEWLNNNNVKYNHLLMAKYDTPEQRRNHYSKMGGNGIAKAQKALEMKCNWFVESDITQAKQIKNIMKTSVFCTDIFDMI